MTLLQDKNCLICGVANKNSIAWGIAKAFYNNGANLFFSCVQSAYRRVNKLAQEVNSNQIFVCDVTQEKDIKSLFENLQTATDGQLDVLVHSMAYADPTYLGGDFLQTPRQAWTESLEVSAYSLLELTKHAKPLMPKQSGGSIITLSYGGIRVHPGYNMMGISKAALEMTARYLAYDLGPDNIRVNVIGSGPIPTLSSQMVENFKISIEKVQTSSPLLRNVTSSDIGDAAVYLASDLSRSVTGHVLEVDSGMDIMAPSVPVHRKLKPKA